MSDAHEPAPEIIMDARGIYWRKYPEHFSMVPTSDDNEAVPKPWVLYRVVQDANPHRERLIEDNRELRADRDRLAAELEVAQERGDGWRDAFAADSKLIEELNGAAEASNQMLAAFEARLAEAESTDPMALTVHLRGLLREVVVAADRMRDNWAESDEAVRKRLWTNLHTAAEASYDEVYPL